MEPVTKIRSHLKKENIFLKTFYLKRVEHKIFTKMKNKLPNL